MITYRGCVQRLLVIILAALLLLAGCDGTASKSHDMESFTQAVRELDGVGSLDTSGDPWLFHLDASLPASRLNELGTELFRLVNDTDFGESPPTFQAVAGVVRASVEIDPETGGRPPGPASLGWAAPLGQMPGVDAVDVAYRTARVTVQPGTDLVDWIAELGQADLTGLEEHPLVVGTEQEVEGLVSARFVPTDAASMAVVDDLVALTDQTGAELVELDASLSRSTADLRVDDVQHARRVVDAAAAQMPDTYLDLRLEAATGERYSGNVEELAEHLELNSELPALVAATGAQLTSSSGERNSYAISVPDAQVLRGVVDLITSPQWTPGPDSSVSVHLGDNPNASSLTARQWAREGELLAAAYDTGLTNTRITQGRGGTREREFDIRFRDSEGIDITTPQGYDLIIELMRGHEWGGEAQIELSEGDHLYFWSTAEGTAQDAYFALHGAPSREPNGWALDFLEAWDATASE